MSEYGQGRGHDPRTFAQVKEENRKLVQEVEQLRRERGGMPYTKALASEQPPTPPEEEYVPPALYVAGREDAVTVGAQVRKNVVDLEAIRALGRENSNHIVDLRRDLDRLAGHR